MTGSTLVAGVGRRGYVERTEVETYQRRGYLPLPTTSCHGSFPAASISLEWSVDDFAISQFASELGDSDTAKDFQDRAQYWQNLFNPTTHSISPRNAMGFFPEGPAVVKPGKDCFSQVGFDEGNAEQYVWYVPQNIAGLVTALGGRDAVSERLDKFTSQLNVGPVDPYLWADNEPNFSVPWLYNYIGQPWKTQELVDLIRDTLFSPTPNGEPGNDDLGAMSAWYVWAAMGLYPSIPGTSTLTVNAPLFDKVEIALPADRFIRVSAPGGIGPSPAAVHRLAACQRAVDRQDVPPAFGCFGWWRVGVLACFEAEQVLGDCRVVGAAVFWGGEFSSVGQRLADRCCHGRRDVTVNVQRMFDGPADYTISGKSSEAGISVASVSGKFGDDGSGTSRVTIKVAGSVRDGYYPLVLTTKGVRRSGGSCSSLRSGRPGSEGG